MLWPDAGARIGSGVDENLVVTHVIHETVEQDRLVEYIIEFCLDLRGIHLRMIPHRSHADERFTPSVGTLTSADPLDLGAQGDLIGTAEPINIEAVLAAPNGGGARLAQVEYRSRRVSRRIWSQSFRSPDPYLRVLSCR